MVVQMDVKWVALMVALKAVKMVDSMTDWTVESLVD
jgi:hypothetical protein